MELKDIISSGLLELYILGLTSEDEGTQVQQWIEKFPEVKQEIDQIQDAMESYALAHAMQPAESVKQKILDKINIAPAQNNFTALPEKTGSAKVYKMPAYYNWLVAAGLILLIGSLIVNYTYYNKYQNASSDLQLANSELSREKEITAGLKEITAGLNKDIDVVTDKNSLPVVLTGTPHAPNALAKIFWMKNTGQVYVDPSNLPEPAAGKQYQLWAFVDGKPVDAGIITTKKGIYKIQKMKSFGKVEAFAITLEKEGGSPTPTVEEIYVMAKI